MLRYAVNRVAWTIPVVLLAITLTFFLVRSTGGDPFRHGPLVGLTAQGGWQKYGDWQPQSIRDNMRRRYGLDLPWYEQYANYVVGVTTFSLGPSLSFRNRTVEEIVAKQGPITLELSLLALAWGVVAGIAAGVGSSLVRRGSPLAHLERLLSSLALAVPAFFVGTLLIYLVAVRGGLLPTSGWDGWQTKVLPALTLGLVPMAYCARLTRGTMVETLGEDYVRSARAKGLRRRRVVLQHALRNSLVPVLSAAGPLLGGMITTLFVVEYVFAIPGLARHYVSAATARDYPLLMGMTVVFTMAVVVANLVVDLLLAWLDPRLRERRWEAST
jgi:oligopeptide transport system permease protein